MKKILKKFLLYASVIIVAISMITPSIAASNLASGDIGDFGQWNTDANHKMLIDAMTDDMKNFAPQPVQLVDDYVPIEAKIGLVMMNGLTHIANILNSSLLRFAVIFMLLAYIFWAMFETYKMMTDGGTKVWDLAKDLVKKGITIAIWIMILNIGPAELFMEIMGPIVSIGTYFADIILNAVTNTVGVTLPDTCGAIREYAATHTATDMLLDADSAANLMCVPTRMSGFLYTAWTAGWRWIGAGFGHSAFTVIVGIVFVILFTINIYKFALMALGVIADLFISILMLPFTAISETISKTKLGGIPGNIFNSFIGLLKAESLSDQIKRFVNAAIYFVSLAIVIGLCTALLALTINTNMANEIPTIETGGFWVTLLTGCLVLHLATSMDKIMSDLGGKIDASMGDKVKKDIETLGKSAMAKGKEWYKLIKEEYFS